MGWSTADRIVVRGLDLPGEILGRLNLGDMAFLELTGRVPNENESRLFNALVVTLVEHGVTPSALVARLTYLGAPEAMQAAVAAGLCGLGSVFVGSTEGCARMLFKALPDPKANADLARSRPASSPSIGRAKRSCPGSDTRSTSRSIRACRGSSRSRARPDSTASM
jgi:citrate synthase